MKVRMKNQKVLICMQCMNDAVRLPNGGGYCPGCEKMIDDSGFEIATIKCAECNQPTAVPMAQDYAFCNFCRQFIDSHGIPIPD